MSSDPIKPEPGATATSDWLDVTQEMIDKFAEATLDHQWIHVDAQRAATGPFGTTIAHGFLTLSLASYLMTSVLDVSAYKQTINYGLNKVRFISPVPVDSAVRAVVEVLDIARTGSSHVMRCRVTLELRHADRPACVAETLTLLPGDPRTA